MKKPKPPKPAKRYWAGFKNNKVVIGGVILGGRIYLTLFPNKKNALKQHHDVRRVEIREV